MKLKTPSRAACTMVVGTLLLVATTIFAQQLAEPSDDDAQTARLICGLVNRYHINHAKVDDGVSERLLKRYVELLDPQKLYFLKADIDEFEKQKTVLDDQVLEGDVSFAFDVFKRYIHRVDERMTYAHQLVDQDHDFTVDEEILTDTKKREWCADVSEINERWRRRVKYDILSLRLEDEKAEDIRGRLHKRYNTLARSINESESGEVLEMYLSSLTHCFDPHSSYLSPESLEEFRTSMQLSLDGIGAALRSEDGYTYVASIVKGGAADKDGRLEVDDKIVAVAQETGDFVDIVEMKLKKVVRLIRGKRGSKVRLQIVKGDSGDRETYELIRQKIELQESAVRGEIIETEGRIGRSARVGVINVPSFYRDFNGAEQGLENFKSTTRDIRGVLTGFQRESVDAVIIDLRYNGGGALAEAVEATGLFIDEGPVVQVKESGNKVRTWTDDIEGSFEQPLIVVCNRMSASASEIFAAAIKDYGRGIVVGDTTTHGKGTVQNIMSVSPNVFSSFLNRNRKDRGALKLTINKFYRVNGDSTQVQGVKSDVVLPSVLDHMDIGEESLENALGFDRIDAATIEGLNLANANIVKQLRRESQKRVNASEDFQETQKDVDEYLERKKGEQSVTLHEEKLRAEREARKKDKDDSDKKEEEDEKPPVLPEGHYNDELLNIAVDYLEALKTKTTASR